MRTGVDRRRYRFGALHTPGSGTEFRLWAPQHRRVEILCRGPGGESVQARLEPLDEGFFACALKDVGCGWRYSYRVDGQGPFPDPASRFQPEDVHGPSEVTGTDFPWTDASWHGRPWASSVVYELHVGTFTAGGGFRDLVQRLDHLLRLGITTVELMPVADFPGRRNWGYDGTFLYAPDSVYGRPEDLKYFVNACHMRGIAVLLDVVYNHFGPDGNYLWPISRRFFSPAIPTPWGDGIDISNPIVAEFIIQNACYWIREFHFDGLRLDAVHAIDPRHRKAFLTSLQQRVRASVARPVCLVLENVGNEADYLRDTGSGAYDAQWNDDFHSAAHVLLTGEEDGHHRDFIPGENSLERVLCSGFVFQGAYSRWERCNRGTSTAGVPASAFVNFLQTHDMCGNRAWGERLHQLIDPRSYMAAVALHLFMPGVPLLFMGEEFAAGTPFLYFTDHRGPLGVQVREGRLEQHRPYQNWARAEARGNVPDPQSEHAFLASKLDWSEAETNAHVLATYRQLLRLRARFQIGTIGWRSSVERCQRLFTVVLRNEGAPHELACVANFHDSTRPVPEEFRSPAWEPVFTTATEAADRGLVPARFATWLRRETRPEPCPPGESPV
jgi:maltooligosyltrehalose trehalohydrolase